MNKRSFYVNNIVFIALCSAITVVCSQVSVPIGPIPVTLQTFAIALSGYLLGAKGGTAAVTVYIITGLIGLPVFAGFKGGISVLFGPTGGFLIGFIVLAFFCGVGKKAKRTFLQLFSGAAGLLLCHALGTVIFSVLFSSQYSFWQAFLTVSAPFLIKDAVSIGAAYLLSLLLVKIKQLSYKNN